MDKKVHHPSPNEKIYIPEGQDQAIRDYLTNHKSGEKENGAESDDAHGRSNSMSRPPLMPIMLNHARIRT